MNNDCFTSNNNQILAADWPMIRQQIKYYFSDYFLNQCKDARRLFVAKQGYKVDDLFKFKRFRSIVSNKEDLLVCLEANACFDSVEYFPSEQLLRRNISFVANKNYKLDNAHKILYLSGLPDGTTIEDIEKVLINFKYTAIETKKRHERKDIHICIIEFDDSANANKFYQFVLSEEFKLGVDGSHRVKVSKFRSYHANLQKYRRAKKRTRKIQLALANLSFSSSDEASHCNKRNSSLAVGNVDDNCEVSKKTLSFQFGFHRLIRRRTIVYTNRQSEDFEKIHSVLNTLGVIYFYRIESSPSKYYLLFRNRHNLEKFYADLGGTFFNDVVLIENDQLKNVHLQKNDFSFIDKEAEIESIEFKAFVRCAKRFLRGKK